MDNKYLSEVNNTIKSIFSKMIIVNPIKDELYKYDITNSNIKFENKASLMEYIENLDDVIFANDKEIYSSLLSGSFDNQVSVPIKAINQYGFEDSIVLAKKIIIEQESIILLLFSSYKSAKKSESVNNSHLVKNISEAFLKINNMIDTNSNSGDLYKYISIELENLINGNQELKSEYSKVTINEVNATANTILIVDDDMMSRTLLKKTFCNEYNIIEAKNGKEAIEILDQNEVGEIKQNFVGMFLDLLMPVMDGFAVLEHLEEKNLITKMPIIILSAVEEKGSIKKVYKYDIADMLEKPFDMDIIKLRTSKFIKLYQSSNVINKLLVKKDNYTTGMLDLLKNKYFDDYSDEIEKVSSITKLLATKYMQIYPNSKLTEPLINTIVEASKYYDIGKLFIKNNSSILEKQEHVKIGAEFISKLFENKRDKIVGDYAKNIALFHHDNYDGSGYNPKMNKDNIPIYASFVSLASFYYYLYKYEKILNHSVISTRIVGESGKKYSPEIINAFRQILGEVNLLFK